MLPEEIQSRREEEKYLLEMGEYFAQLPIEDLIRVLTDPVSQDEAMDAACLMPKLMERVHEAFDAMPSPLTPEEERAALYRGEHLAERMLARVSSGSSSPLTCREALPTIRQASHYAISVSTPVNELFRPSRMSIAAREHVEKCAACQSGLEILRKNAHPRPEDLLFYYAGILSSEDAQVIERHLSEFCPERSCGRFYLLSGLRNRINRVAEGVDKVVADLLSFTLDLPEPELLYAESDCPKFQFHETVTSGDWEMTIEQAPEDRFFLGIRSHVPREDVTHLQVAILRGDTVFETELSWQSDQYWSAKEHFDGFDQLIGDAGEASVLVIPLA